MSTAVSKYLWAAFKKNSVLCKKDSMKRDRLSTHLPPAITKSDIEPQSTILFRHRRPLLEVSLYTDVENYPRKENVNIYLSLTSTNPHNNLVILYPECFAAYYTLLFTRLLLERADSYSKWILSNLKAVSVPQMQTWNDQIVTGTTGVLFTMSTSSTSEVPRRNLSIYIPQCMNKNGLQADIYIIVINNLEAGYKLELYVVQQILEKEHNIS